jgi:hypothetical protein
MSWFHPVATPPTIASLLPRHHNARASIDDNCTLDGGNHDPEIEDIDIDSANHYIATEYNWKVATLSRRLEQLISPIGHSSWQMSSKGLACRENNEHKTSSLTYPEIVNGNELDREKNPSKYFQESAHFDPMLCESLPGNLLPGSCTHPTIHFHSKLQDNSEKTSFVHFFYPRPVRCSGRGSTTDTCAISASSFYYNKENSPMTHTLGLRNSIEQQRQSGIAEPNIREPDWTDPFSRHDQQMMGSKYIGHPSYNYNPSHPDPVIQDHHQTNPTYTQALLTRNGQLTSSRHYASSLDDHTWDQVGQNIATYKSSTQQNQPQTDSHKRTQKRKVKRPLPESNAMTSPPQQVHRDESTKRIRKKKKSCDSRHDSLANEHRADASRSRKTDGAVKHTMTQRGNHDNSHESSTNLRESVLCNIGNNPSSYLPIKSSNVHPNGSREASQRHTARIHWKTFQILEEMYQLCNAGADMDCLRHFLEIVKQSRVVSWTFLFYDRHCTSPFLPLTKRYCTEKGPPCTMWNCTCDQQSRAVQSSAPVAGVLFCLPSTSSSSSSMNTKEDLRNFFLPLGPTAETVDDNDTSILHPGNIDEGYERMIHWPLLPIRCDTSIKQRWDAFRFILMNKFITCVTYNAIMGLMPYHYHCLNDSTSSIDSTLDWNLPKIWDLRVASWLLAPNTDETELEFERKLEGFSHFVANSDIPQLPDDASDHLRGFVLSIRNLHFLNKVYPLINDLLSRNGLLSAFEEIESPLLSTLSAMECHGIGFLSDQFIEMQSQIECRIEQLSYDARLLAKDPSFLLSSPQQVSHLLYDIMKIPDPQRMTTKVSLNMNRHRSTSEETLKMIQAEALAQQGSGYHMIDIILEFRTLNKMLTSYIRPYPSLCRHVMQDSRLLAPGRRSKKEKKPTSVARIHPMWVQTAVRTGRLSCRKPNMQQIPTNSVFGVHPRSAFVATSSDMCLFSFDYSQNEVRILAHMSGDSSLISLFHSSDDIDIYKLMSSAITGKPVEFVDDKERAISKQASAIHYILSRDLFPPSQPHRLLAGHISHSLRNGA